MTNNVNYNTIPETLKCKPNWLFWKYETIDGKKTKPPTSVNGSKINPHDPNNLYPFSIVEEKFDPQIHEGIGFTLTGSGFIGFDFDDCLTIPNDFSSLKDWAVPIVELLKGNYIEISPSGNGIKSFIKGKKPDWINKTHIKKGDGKIEIHDHQYFTITGNVIDYGNGSSDKQDQINSLCHYLFPEQLEQEQPPTPSTTPTSSQTSGIDLQQRLEKARQASNGAEFTVLFDQGDISQYDNDHSRADLALCQKLAFWLGKDEALIDQAFRQSKLYRENKWNNKHRGDGATYGQMTIKKAISRTSKVYQGKAKVETQATVPRSAPTAFEVPRDYLMGSDRYYAESFVKDHGQDLRWCYDMEKWIVWNGKRWEIGKDHLVDEKMEQYARRMKEEIFMAKNVFMDNSEFDEKDLKRMINRATKISNISCQRSVLEYSKRYLPIEARDLDLDIYLLNFKNCTVDLRTGEQLPHSREDYITKMIPYDYNHKAKAEQWPKFVDEIMGYDAEMVEYLQLAMGHACNGSTDEQSLFMLHGMGANGKSTFCEAILDALGDYAKTVADDFFVAKHQREHPTEIADLQGARLVVGSEFGGVMDEGKVKRLTGSDKLKARFMRGDMFEFAPTQTYFVCVNNKPTVRNTDDGIWRRVKLVPFSQKFSGEKRDKHLPKKLKLEHQAILTWLVDGAVRSYKDGIIEPEAVRVASQGYREEYDLIGRFIDDCCDTSDPHSKIKSSQLYKAYEKWAETNGEFKHGNRQFSDELKRKDFEKAKNGWIFWHGIDLSESYRQWDLEGLEGKKHNPQENRLSQGMVDNSPNSPNSPKSPNNHPHPLTVSTPINTPIEQHPPQTPQTDELSYASGDNGQVSNRQTHTGRGNGQVGQVDSLYAREEGNLSDNGFHLSTCPNVEFFNGLDFEKRFDILVRQYWSAGGHRQDLSFEDLKAYEVETYLVKKSGNELSDLFSDNLELLKSMEDF